MDCWPILRKMEFLGQLFRARDQLGQLSPSKDVPLSSLEEVTWQLPPVGQSPSQLTLPSRVLAVTNLGEYKLLRHKDGEVRLVVAHFLSEVVMVTAPKIRYKGNIMSEIFQLIAESFQGIDQMDSPSFSKRAQFLKLMAKVRSCTIMLEYGYHDLVLQLFHYFPDVISKNHSNTQVPNVLLCQSIPL